jgi:hypothetical protein
MDSVKKFYKCLTIMITIFSISSMLVNISLNNVQGLKYSNYTNLSEIKGVITIGSYISPNTIRNEIVGDVNGDGFDDIVIANREWSTFRGEVYVFFGSKDGLNQKLNISMANVTIKAEVDEQMLGQSIAGIGDTNGDGYADFVIGAPFDSQNGQETGQVYLMLGRHTWPKELKVSNADASFIGATLYQQAGWSLSGPGDLNGDGYDDILIGAPLNICSSCDDRGIVYIIFGKSDGWKMRTNLSSADAWFHGKNKGTSAGDQVSGIGDVNKDGFKDFIVVIEQGSKTEDRMAYIVFGKATGWAKDVNLTNADATIATSTSDNSLDAVVKGVGDVNGDGFDDFLIGEPYNAATCAYLFFGRATNWAFGMDMDKADVKIAAERSSDYCGRSIASVHDVNGDGLDDFIIGAPMNGYPQIENGQVYLFLGRTNWNSNLQLSSSNASFVGEAAYNYTGRDIAGGGDVNGDNLDDLLILSESWPYYITYIISPEDNKGPQSIVSVRAYSDPDCLKQVSFVLEGQTFYIQLEGSDPDPHTMGLTKVFVTSTSFPTGIWI